MKSDRLRKNNFYGIDHFILRTDCGGHPSPPPKPSPPDCHKPPPPQESPSKDSEVIFFNCYLVISKCRILLLRNLRLNICCDIFRRNTLPHSSSRR